MRMRACWPLVALVTVALTGCGSTDVGVRAARVPGCTVPDDEDALLDAYADDPVLAVRPDDARAGDVVRGTGCRQLNKEDVSNTSVVLTWRPERDYDGPTLRHTFDPTASGAGWRYAVDPDAAPDVAGETTLTYCRSVRGVTSRLLIRAQAEQRQDTRPSTADRPASPQWSVVSPALIYLTIYADPVCPKP